MLPPAVRRALPLLLALAITTWGGLLRLDALVERYGAVDSPAWARVLTDAAPRWAAHLKPSAHQWTAIATPYVGGDPINYLRYGREMQTFYQAHVREPVFLAETRLFLWLLDGADVAVSVASAAGSTVAVLGAYLVAAAVVSPIAGLAVALLMAGEYHLITWGIDGWRDDTFMALLLLTLWSFLQLRRRPSFAPALLAGAAAGLACLTRITALSFVLPALAMLVLDAPPGERRRRAAMTGLAAAIAAAVVLPYLVSCALATGDPFFAINYHTSFYRFGEGLPSGQPMSAASYITGKLAGHPIRAIDTAFQGLTVQPFANKFGGFEAYAPHLGTVLMWTAAAGLMALPFTPAGRLLLVVLLASLVPYVLTWNIASGGEWRFTMHAYPLYLVAALVAVDGAVRGAAAAWRSGGRMPALPRRTIVGMAVVASIAVLGCGVYVALPWLVVRETVASGQDVSIETGPRDGVFFDEGWSEPHSEGVMVRVSTAPRAEVRFPLPVRRAYDVVVRLDPAVPGRQHRVAVLFNRQMVGTLKLAVDAARMGSYRLRLPAALVRCGSNELVVVPDTLVAAGAAAPRLDWIDPAQPVGVRLWYVRILGLGS